MIGASDLFGRGLDEDEGANSRLNFVGLHK